MRLTRRSVLGAATVSVGLGGCLDQDGETPNPADPTGTTEPPTTTEPPGTTEPEGPTASVQVATHPELGEILVGPSGRTLYMFDNDARESGVSSCYDGCATAWPPLTATDPVAGEGVTATVTAFEREPGDRQIAASGWPLYYWQGDAAPGDATGQGVNGVWWVLRPDGTPVRPSPTVEIATHPALGEILVGPSGRTLYMFDNDDRGSGTSSCYDGCAAAWPPLTVDDEPMPGEGVTGPLGVIERETGERQVTVDGWPVYYWQNDEEPGEATGQGVNDIWWVLRPDGTPVRASATVTVATHPDHGDILVGPEGMTLYMFDNDDRGSGASSCYDGCATAWPPLTVDGDPMGGERVRAELTTFERATGDRQVAANGWPVYYWQNDAAPGDATGHGVNGVWWVLDPEGTPIKPTGSSGSSY